MTTLNDTIRATESAPPERPSIDGATAEEMRIARHYADMVTYPDQDHAELLPRHQRVMLAVIRKAKYRRLDGMRAAMTPADRKRYDVVEGFLESGGHDLCDALLCGDDLRVVKLITDLAKRLPNDHDGACTCGEEHG